MRLIGEREANSEKNLPQQAESKKPDAQQRSERANSPSIVGNNNTVTINMARQPKLEGFREKVEEVSFSFGSGMTDTETVDRLRREVYRPFNFNGFHPVRLHMKKDVFLFGFTIWGGKGKPPVEVKDNEFTVRGLGYDRNSSANALEIINADGIPLFQMIRKTPTDVVVNGVFPIPSGGLILAGPEGLLTGAGPDQLADFHLPPIFKYPSWRYPGEYADEKKNGGVAINQRGQNNIAQYGSNNQATISSDSWDLTPDQTQKLLSMLSSAPAKTTAHRFDCARQPNDLQICSANSKCFP